MASKILFELTGIPCSGKTTELMKIRSLVGGHVCDIDWIDSQLHISNFWKLRPLIREVFFFYSGLYALTIPKVVKLLLTLNLSGWSIVRKLNVFRNILRLFSLNRLIARSSDEILILDEGLTHLHYIFATSDIKCPPDILGIFPYIKPQVIILDCPLEVLKTRLLHRRHDMLKYYSIDDFVSLNLEAQQHQAECLEEHSILKTIYPTDFSRVEND